MYTFSKNQHEPIQQRWYRQPFFSVWLMNYNRRANMCLTRASSHTSICYLVCSHWLKAVWMLELTSPFNSHADLSATNKASQNAYKLLLSLITWSSLVHTTPLRSIAIVIILWRLLHQWRKFPIKSKAAINKAAAYYPFTKKLLAWISPTKLINFCTLLCHT